MAVAQATSSMMNPLDLLTFLKGMGGSTQSGSSTTSIDPKFLEGLQQLLGTQMGQTTPEGAAKMIQDIFAQGSKAAPQLATQLAGAVGARTGNNSALATGNIQLQSELASKAMQMLAGLQRDAGATATSLAQAAPKTTTESKTTGTSTSGKLMTALPFLLGNADKIKKLGSGLFAPTEMTDAGFGSVPGGSGGFGQIVNNPSAFIGGSVNGGSDFSGASFVPEAGGDMFSSGFSDYSGVTGLTDTSAASSADFLSSFDATQLIPTTDYFDAVDAFGFADGGKVPTRESIYSRRRAALDSAEEATVKGDGTNEAYQKRMQPVVPQQLPTPGVVELVRKVLGFANGGRVPDPTMQMAAPGAMALNDPLDIASVASSFAGDSGAVEAPQLPVGGRDFSADVLGEDVISYFAGDNTARTEFRGQDGYLYRGTNEDFQYSGSEGEQVEGGRSTQIQRYSSSEGGKDYDMDKQVANKFDKTFNPDGSYRDITINSPMESEMGGFLQFAGMVAALATGNPAAFARSIGMQAGKAAVGDAMSKNLPANLFGGVNKRQVAAEAAYMQPGGGRDQSRQFANGGEIRGPGTGTSDSIPIKASAGEYIVPADVTAMLGTDFLDKLTQLFHTPVGAK